MVLSSRFYILQFYYNAVQLDIKVLPAGLTSSGCEALDTQNCGGADPGTGALPGPPITSDAASFCGLAPGSELRDPGVRTDSCLSLPLVMRTGPRDRCLTNKGKFLYLFLSCGQGYCLPIFPLPISIL